MRIQELTTATDDYEVLRMMYDFLIDNRQDLIDRCMAKVAQRPARVANGVQLQNGIPIFLDQLIRTLRAEQTGEPMEVQKISGPTGGAYSSSSEVGKSAALHGRELLQHGFSIDEVVHDYGDLCQAVTDLAYELDAPFQVGEFRTLNRCLDNAIAEAVTEFSYQRASLLANQQANAVNERLRGLGRQLRNHLGTATFAFAAASAGNLSFTSATGRILEKNLIDLRDIVDHSFAEILMTSENPVQFEIFSVADFIAEVKRILDLDARDYGCALTVLTVDTGLAVNADRELLFSALENLLKYAFSLTNEGSEVTLNAYAVVDRVQIDVNVDGNSVPLSDSTKAFPHSEQVSDYVSNSEGRLTVVRRSVEANNGKLNVLDVSARGRVFSISLPRYTSEWTGGMT
jgi:signal transduction histidine kinase